MMTIHGSDREGVRIIGLGSHPPHINTRARKRIKKRIKMNR
jgi:hypothetical protein